MHDDLYHSEPDRIDMLSQDPEPIDLLSRGFARIRFQGHYHVSSRTR